MLNDSSFMIVTSMNRCIYCCYCFIHDCQMILDIALLFSNLLGYVDALLMNEMLSLLQLLNDMVVA